MSDHVNSSLPALALVALLVFSPASAAAIDCTPLDSFGCGGSAYQNYVGTDAVPGEMACGTDYTGWDFQVFDVVVTVPNVVALASYTSTFDPALTFNHLLLFEHCDLTQCIDSDTSVDLQHQLTPCLDVGTYTLIVATKDVPSQSVMAVGSAGCADCEPVAIESRGWGAVKSIFR